MASPAAYARRQFPGAASDTTISAGISDSATSVSLTTASGWPTGTYTGGILVEFYSVTTGATLEKAWAASLSGTTLTLHADGRGADGTSAIAHVSGVGIRPASGARDADEANKAAHETVGQITAAGEVLVADGVNSLVAVQAKTSGYILVGNGTTVASVAVSGDVTLSAAGEVQIAAGAVGATEIATDGVGTAEIAADAVTASEIATGAVGTDELAANAVTTAKILDGTIVNGDIADGTITNAKLATPPSSTVDLNALTTDTGPALTDYLPFVDVSESNASNKMLLTELLKLVYPVEAIFISYSSTNPATTFGFGTWSQVAQGEALVGFKAADTPFGTLGSIGGSGTKTHTLTEAEMPVHNHEPSDGASFRTNDSGSANTIQSVGSGGLDNGLVVSTNNAGSGSAHNNIQPSYVAYVWRRTA